MEESKVDNVEEARASITSITKKDDIVDEIEYPRATSVSNRPNLIILLENITKTPKIIIV